MLIHFTSLLFASRSRHIFCVCIRCPEGFNSTHSSPTPFTEQSPKSCFLLLLPLALAALPRAPEGGKNKRQTLYYVRASRLWVFLRGAVYVLLCVLSWKWERVVSSERRWCHVFNLTPFKGSDSSSFLDSKACLLSVFSRKGHVAARESSLNDSLRYRD